MDCCAAGPVIELPNAPQTFVPDGKPFVIDGQLIALVVSGFVAGNSTLFALVANLNQGDQSVRFYFHTGLLVATLSVMALLGPPLLKSLISSIFNRSLSIDALFALGCCGALVFSLISYLTGEGPVYFEIVSILLVIRAVGNRIKTSNRARVINALGAWDPGRQQCRVLGKDGNLTLQSVAEIQTGQRVVVPVGAMIPVDGEVVAGQAFISESTITGEPHLKSVKTGDRVVASSVTIDGPLQIETHSPGDQRAIDRVAAAVKNAMATPSRIQKQADRIARSFTPIVALIASLSLIVWWIHAGPQTAILVALAVLLVACPCAFGFATPIAVWATLSRLAVGGIVVHRADLVERLADVDTVVFDKTGTLTTTRPRLSKLIIRNLQQWNDHTVASLVRSLEACSNHPIAQPFIEINVPVHLVKSFKTLPGIGVQGKVMVKDEPLEVKVGALDQLRRPCCDDDWIESVLSDDSGDQQTIGVRVNDHLIAIALVDEQPIETLDAGLAELKSLGVEMHVCSGDQQRRVIKLGIKNALGNVGPEQKFERVKSLQRTGRRVLFVGDGVNDSAAMAAADASIAVAQGAELTQSVADAGWHGQDLRSIATAIMICRKTVSRLRSTLWFAVGYNTLGMVVAAAGYLHPVFAVILMMASSLFVVIRAANPGGPPPGTKNANAVRLTKAAAVEETERADVPRRRMSTTAG